jgi:hypothetical protein
MEKEEVNIFKLKLSQDYYNINLTRLKHEEVMICKIKKQLQNMYIILKDIHILPEYNHKSLNFSEFYKSNNSVNYLFKRLNLHKRFRKEIISTIKYYKKNIKEFNNIVSNQ